MTIRKGRLFVVILQNLIYALFIWRRRSPLDQSLGLEGLDLLELFFCWGVGC